MVEGGVEGGFGVSNMRKGRYQAARGEPKRPQSAAALSTLSINSTPLATGDNRPGFFKHLLASKLIESGNEPNLADKIRKKQEAGRAYSQSTEGPKRRRICHCAASKVAHVTPGTSNTENQQKKNSG
eukprot:g34509.t1